MEFLSTALMALDFEAWQTWFVENWAMTALTAAVLIQWVALQVLAIHYYLFRKSLRQPRPDRIRLATLERAVKFQEEQFDRLFEKLSSVREEMASIGRSSSETASTSDSAQSIENSFVTLGERQLQKRIREWQTKTTN